jgi:SET domain
MMTMLQLKQTALLAAGLLLLTLTPTRALSSPNNKTPPDASSRSTSLAYRSAAETGFVEIRPCADAEKGLGAFCTQNIPFGQFIGEYYGEILTESQVRARYYGKSPKTNDDHRWAACRESRQQGTTGNYVFELKQNNMFVDAEDAERSSWCRFMNHAEVDEDACNVKAFDKLTIHGELVVYPQFYAVRDIQKGEELCYFYGDYGHLLWEQS